MKTNYKFIRISDCLYQNCQFRYEKEEEKDFYLNATDTEAAEGLFHSARHSDNVLCFYKVYIILSGFINCRFRKHDVTLVLTK
jgi:hypothetical protein